MKLFLKLGLILLLAGQVGCKLGGGPTNEGPGGGMDGGGRGPGPLGQGKPQEEQPSIIDELDQNNNVDEAAAGGIQQGNQGQGELDNEAAQSFNELIANPGLFQGAGFGGPLDPSLVGQQGPPVAEQNPNTQLTPGEEVTQPQVVTPDTTPPTVDNGTHGPDVGATKVGRGSFGVQSTPGERPVAEERPASQNAGISKGEGTSPPPASETVPSQESPLKSVFDFRNLEPDFTTNFFKGLFGTREPAKKDEPTKE